MFLWHMSWTSVGKLLKFHAKQINSEIVVVITSFRILQDNLSVQLGVRQKVFIIHALVSLEIRQWK